MAKCDITPRFDKRPVVTEKRAKKILDHLTARHGIEGVLEDMGVNSPVAGRFARDQMRVHINQYSTLDAEGNFTASEEATGFIDRRTIFHEYLHPFVELLHTENSELFEEIHQEAEAANKEHKFFTNLQAYSLDQRQEELVVRYMEQLSDQDGVPSLLERFLQWLSELFHSKASKDVDLKTLSTDTTVEQLYDIFKEYGTLKEDAAPVIQRNVVTQQLERKRRLFHQARLSFTPSELAEPRVRQHLRELQQEIQELENMVSRFSIREGAADFTGDVESQLFPAIQELGISREQAKEIYSQVFDDNFLAWFGDWTRGDANPMDRASHVEFNQAYRKKRRELGRLISDLIQSNNGIRNAPTRQLVAQRSSERDSIINNIENLSREIEQEFGQSVDLDMIDDYASRVPVPHGEPGTFFRQIQDINDTADKLLNTLLPKEELIDTDFQRYQDRSRAQSRTTYATGEPILVSPATDSPVMNMIDSAYIGDQTYGRGKYFTAAHGDGLQAGFIRMTAPISAQSLDSQYIGQVMTELFGELSEDTWININGLNDVEMDMAKATHTIERIIKNLEKKHNKNVWSHKSDIRNVWELFGYDGIIDGDNYVVFNAYDWWAAWNNEEANQLPDPQPQKKTPESRDKRTRTLDRLATKFNAEVEYVDSLPGQAIARVRQKAGRPLIQVVESEMTSDTIFHEYAHILIDGIGGLDNPMVQRGVQLLKDTPLWQEVSGRYRDVSDSLVAKEVLAEAMGREMDQMMIADETLIGQIKNWLQLMMDRIRKVFGLQTDAVRDLSRQVLSEQLRSDFDMSRLPEHYQQKRRENKEQRRKLNKKLKAYEETIDRIEHRIQELAYKDDPASRAALERTKYELRKDLQDSLTYSGMIYFINQADSDLNDLYTELYNAMEGGDLSADQLKQIYDAAQTYNTLPEIDRVVTRDPEMAKELGPEYIQLLDGLRHTLEEIEQIYQEETFEFAVDFLMENARRKKREIEKEYEREWRENNQRSEYTSDDQYELSMNKHVAQRMETEKNEIELQIEDDIRQKLKTALQDVGSFEYWITAMKNVDDEILQIVAESVDQQEMRVIRDTFDLEKDVADFLEPLREHKGNPADPVKLYEDMLERDENGNLTGYMVSEYSSLYQTLERGFLTKTEVDRQNDPRLWHLKREEFYRKHGKRNPAHIEWQKQRDAARKRLSSEEFDNWAVENPQPREYIPSDKYKNPQFRKFDPNSPEYLGDDHPVVRFYQFFMRKQKQFDDMIPIQRRRLGYSLPSIKKDTIERISAGDFSGVMDNLKDQFYFAVDDVYEGELTTETDDKGRKVYVRRDARGRRLQHVPIHYRGEVDPKDQSFDLGTLLVLNGHASMNYKYKNQILADLQMVQEQLARRRVGQFRGGKQQMMKDSPNRPYTIPGEQSKSYKLMDKFMEHRLFGRHTTDEDPLVDWSKPIGTFMSYTGMLLLGGNVLAGVANTALGESLMLAEAVSGEYIDTKNWRKAQAYYTRHLANGDIVSDIGREKYHSIINLLMKRYDALNTYQPWSHKFSNKNRAMRMMRQHHIYALNNVGEHMMHNMTLLALLDRTKAANAKGEWINGDGKVVKSRDEAVSVLSMYRAEDGDLILDDKVKRIEWDGKFYDPGDDFEFRVTQRTRQLNEFMHGAYADQNSNVLQRYALGRMAIMMRKWIEPGIRRRFSGAKRTWEERKEITGMGYGRRGPKWDQQLDDFHEGTMTTVYRFYRSIRNSEENFKHALIANWHRMSKSERANIHRVVTEFAIMLPALAFAHIMYSIARDIEDDDEANRYWYLGYQSNRLFSEMFFFYPPLNIQEAYRVLKSPAATISVIERSMRLFGQVFDPWDEYKSGRRKGELKIKKYSKDMVPFFGPVDRMKNMADLVNIVYN